MTIEQIGKAYKEKNPGRFDGFSDREVGITMIQRKPELKNIVSTERASVSTPTEELKPFRQNVDEYLKDFKIGALKGIVSDVKGASSIGERTLNSILQTALPRSAERAIGIDEAPNLGIVGRQRGGETSAAQLQADVESRFGLREGALTTASNPAQRTGMMTEQVAGFLLPGSAGLRAGRAAETALKLRNVPKWLQIAGRVGGTAAVEAGAGGGVTAIQEGEINSDVISNAVVAGTLPIVFAGASAALRPVQKFLSEKLPSKMINNLIRPGKNDFNFGKNPGQAVVDEGITANSREGLLKQIRDKKDEIGAIKGDALDAVPEGINIDIAPLLTPIDNAMEQAVKSGERNLFSRLQDLKDGLTKEFSVVDGKLVTGGDKSLIMTPKQADLLKQQIGNDTKWTGQAFDNDINKVRRDLYSRINDAIDEAVGPLGETGTRIKELNQRWANMLTAEKALENRIAVEVRNNMISLQDTGVGVGAGIASVASGAGAPQAILNSLTLIAGRKLVKSTAVSTRLAQYLEKLAPTDREVLQKALPSIRAILLEAND